MAQGKVIIAILLLVAVVGGIFLFSAVSKNPWKAAGVINNPEENSQQAAGTGEGNVIEITSSGFNPGTLTISKGETVTFINKDTEEHWPASAKHPTHTVYSGASYDEPGSYQGSLACKGEGESKTGAFDACRGLASGEIWSFTFNEIGSWGYHDHLDSSLWGKIIVE